MKAPEISITVTDLTLRFPVYGVDSKSLKKHLARITVGGKLGKTGLGAPEITALSKVNLQLRSGDRLGLIGHNGSGKTTLLRALAGAYEPDEGTIDVHGRIAAMLDLNLGIDPSATGLDNIRLRGRIAGLSTRQIDERLTEIAEFTGLGPFLAMPLKTYSAGMQARLQELLATTEAVRAVDTEGVAPMLHPQSAMGALQLRLHDDIASEPDQREANQRNAPATHNGLYLVPRVIE